MNQKDRHSWKKEKLKQTGIMLSASRFSYTEIQNALGRFTQTHYKNGDSVPLAPNKNRLSQKGRRKRAKWV